LIQDTSEVGDNEEAAGFSQVLFLVLIYGKISQKDRINEFVKKSKSFWEIIYDS